MHICFMTTSAHPYTKTPDPGALSLVFLLNYHKLVHIVTYKIVYSKFSGRTEDF